MIKKKLEELEGKFNPKPIVVVTEKVSGIEILADSLSTFMVDQISLFRNFAFSEWGSISVK